MSRPSRCVLLCLLAAATATSCGGGTESAAVAGRPSPTPAPELRGEPLGSPELALEFDAPADLSRLQQLSDVEGGPSRLESKEVAQGRLRLVPQAGGWFEDRRAAYLFTELEGDVVAHARVTSTSERGGVPTAIYSLAGLMAREAQPREELTQRGKADYVFVTTGTGEGGGQIETKTTDDGTSRLNLVAGGAPEPVDLLLARVGSTVITAYRNPGSPWAVARVYERPDLPARLQWGLNAYSGFDRLDKAFWGDVSRYNTTETTVEGADLVADVDFVRFHRPRVAPGQDLVRADREQLLRLLTPGS